MGAPGRPEPRPGGGDGRRRGPGMMGMGMGLPPAKSQDFRARSAGCSGELRPEMPRIALVLVLAIVSVHLRDPRAEDPGRRHQHHLPGASSAGSIPAGATQAQVVAGLRASGQGQLADMIQR